MYPCARRRWVNPGLFERSPAADLWIWRHHHSVCHIGRWRTTCIWYGCSACLPPTALEYITRRGHGGPLQSTVLGYSKHRFQLNGHICLSSSIAWGFFSIFLVRFLHPPIGRLLLDIPSWCVDPLALVLTAVFTVDVVRSVQAAMDLREVLMRVTEENEELRRLAKRAEVAAALCRR